MHFDFYRIASPAELAEIGFQEYVNGGAGVCVIEWAEKVEELLPSERYEIRIEFGETPEERLISIRRFEAGVP